MEEENTNENNEKIRSFHVLLMGKDVMMYQRILFEASSYTTLESSVYQQPINLFGCVMNDGDNFIVHGGSLALAASSVCVIPNLLQLKKSEVEQLSKVCESHEVILKLSRSDKHQLNQVSYPFNGSLWCCIESIKENETLFEPLTRQFHVVLKESNLDEAQADDQQIAIASQLLKKSTRFSNIVSKNDMKQFIKAAQATKVTMLGSSEDLLKAYYLLYRNSNPSYSSNVDMELLTHLATAHAKAMFHEEVTIDDAVLSICLFEQLSYQKTGTSLFGVKTAMFFNHDKVSFHIGPQNDERLTLLKEHIISYCSSRLPHIYGVR